MNTKHDLAMVSVNFVITITFDLDGLVGRESIDVSTPYVEAAMLYAGNWFGRLCYLESMLVGEFPCNPCIFDVAIDCDATDIPRLPRPKAG